MSKFNSFVNNLLLEITTPPPRGTAPADNISATSTPAIDTPVDVPNDWFEIINKKHQEIFHVALDLTNKNQVDYFWKAVSESTLTQNNLAAVKDLVHLVAYARYIIAGYNNKPISFDEFLSTASKTKNVPEKVNDILKRVENATAETWDIRIDGATSNAYLGLLKSEDALANVAIESYNSYYVIPAVTAILKRREDVEKRMMHFGIFNSGITKFINSIFTEPENYINGSKKLPAGTGEVYQGLYINNLLKIGLYAKIFVTNILKEQGIDKVLPEYIINVLSGKKFNIPNPTSAGTDTGTREFDSAEYKLEKIKTLNTTESKNLYEGIKSIAQYTSTATDGRAKKMQALGSIAQGLSRMGSSSGNSWYIGS